MNAGDRALAVLRAGLAAKRDVVRRPKPTRCEYERHLNDMPPPADGPCTKKYGSWLHDNRPDEFLRGYEAWRIGR